jgi:gas vesicle protein
VASGAMNKLYAILFGFIASLFIANQRGKKEGKEQEESKNIKETLKNVSETQERVNKYNSTSSTHKRSWLRERKSPRNK